MLFNKRTLVLSVILFYYAITISQNSYPIDSLERVYTQFSEEAFNEITDWGGLAYSKGDYADAFKLFALNHELAIATDENFFIAKTNKNLGYVYLSFRDTTLAREHFEKGLAAANRDGDPKLVAGAVMTLANLHREREDYEKSEFYFEDVFRRFSELKDSTSLSKAYMNALGMFSAKGDMSKLYEKVKVMRKLTPFLDIPPVHASLEQYTAEYFLDQGNYILAKQHVNKGIEIAKENGLDIELTNLYPAAAKIAAEEGLFEKAYSYKLLADSLDIIRTRSRREDETRIVSAKMQIAEFAQEAQNATLEKELALEVAENKTKINRLLLGLVGLTLLILGISISAYLKRKKMNKALHKKNAEYLEAKEKSERLALAKSKFFSTVSHELRTPLYGVIGLSTILLENKGLEDHKEDLKTLKFSADYLLALINDVLQLSKIDSNKFHNEEINFDLKEQLQGIFSSFEYMRLQNKNELVLELDPDLPKLVKGNSFRLSQVLMNLVGNACKFTENGQVTLKVDLAKDLDKLYKLRFSVKDTGIGIAPNKRALIFDEFSQVENADYTYQGTGLGLPIVARLLALSNSKIELESELGKGSNFWFELEFLKADDEALQKEKYVFDIKVLEGKRILVAEDNRINQIVTKKILERNKMTCEVAQNGEEVVLAAKSNTYDLILMDLNMPLKSGFVAAKEIRMSNKAIPIVALTAVEVDEVRNDIYDSGMNDIIVKPYDNDMFLQVISRNLLGNDSVLSSEEKRTG